MANNIGIKFTAEGENNLKKALSSVNAELKLAGSELKLVDSQFDKNDKSIEATRARTEAYNKVLEAQKKKLDILQKELAEAAKQYGENSTQAQNLQRQINETQAAINNTTREMDKNTKSAKENEEGQSKLAQTLGTVGKAFAAAAAAAAAAAVAMTKALAECTVQAAEFADTVNTESAVTGIATDTLQEYMYAAELVDVSVDTLTRSMQKNIKAMTSGSAEQQAAYEALGVSTRDVNGELRDSQTVYWEVIDALGKIENETERDGLAMTLLGKSAQDLNPLIEAGAEKMQELAGKARDAGYVMSQDSLDSFNEFDDQLQYLKVGATAAKNALGSILLPALTSLSSDGVSMLGKFTNAVNDSDGDLEKMVDNVAQLVPEAVELITKHLSDAVNFIGRVLKTVIPEVLKTVGKLLLDNFPSLVEGFVELVQNVADWLTENLSPILTSVIEALGVVVSTLLQNLPTLLKAVIQIIIAVCSALLDNLPLIIETIIEMVPEIIVAIIDSLPVLIDGIAQLIVKLVAALPDILAALWDGFKKIFSKQGVEKFKEMGRNLLEGLKEGIMGAVTSVLEAVSGVGKKLIDGIKKVFGIHSPSTVFAGIGENMALGLENGFVDTMQDARSSIAGAIPSSFSTSYSGSASYAAGSADALLREQNQLLKAILQKDTSVQIGDDVIGRANARYVKNRGQIMNGGLANAY